MMMTWATPQLTEVVGEEANAIKAFHNYGIWACPPDLSEADRAEVAELRLLHDQRLLYVTDLPEFSVLRDMRHRCRNPNHRQWSAYGGRGITVCEEWQKSFWAFMADMGRRPTLPGFVISIDRIDNDAGYFPGNCRWSTQSEQLSNRRPELIFWQR
jgi:hypothetical protein